jgi:hypothetical protein
MAATDMQGSRGRGFGRLEQIQVTAKPFEVRAFVPQLELFGVADELAVLAPALCEEDLASDFLKYANSGLPARLPLWPGRHGGLRFTRLCGGGRYFFAMAKVGILSCSHQIYTLGAPIGASH